MHDLSVQDWQLLSLFGVEPRLLDADVMWYYNDATYEVEQGELKLNFAIDPAYRDIRLSLSLAEETLYDLNAKAVADVCYRKEDNLESLEIKISERETLTLRVKPQVAVSHRLEIEPT